MFFFWLIVGIVLTIAAIANTILTNLSDIVSVLASLIFFGWTLFRMSVISRLHLRQFHNI